MGRSEVEPPTGGHWFEAVAEHLGSAYLRYSFTYGTVNEVDHLVEWLGLEPGMSVLDVGCGPGRHAHELGRRGIAVRGVDISERFIEIGRVDAPDGVTFERADARNLTAVDEYDAAISLCQGAFGLAGGTGSHGGGLDPDLAVIEGMARAVRPGGAIAVSAFSAYFQIRYLESTDTFDVAAGVNHEHTEIKSESGTTAPAELWTSCFTPRELRLLAAQAGLRVEAIWSVTPGDYAARQPDLDHPEFLSIFRV